MHTQIEVGTYRVSKATVYHYAGYECAAWWRDVKVDAGDYPVFGYLEGSTFLFTVTLPGILVAANFQSLFGGVAFGLCYDETQHAGELDTFRIQSRDYCVFGSMRDGEKSPWHIDLSLLPMELAICSDCGGVIAKHSGITRCPSCSVERDQARRQHACRRHRFLLANGYSLRTTRDSPYLDSIIAQAGADEGSMVDFYVKILKAEIASMRSAGPQARVAARLRYPVPVHAFVSR
jgi:predicted RNA-binding Zn-ribbon protein involved in translation (DUF1610 family)